MRSILNADSCCWEGHASRSHVIIDACAYYAAFHAAASVAQRYILLAGWQFDTGVRLLRGARAEASPYPAEFLPFLNALCRQRPQLRVYILAWDYSLVYSLEREWLQGLKFAFQSSDSIRFEFAAHPSIGGSHHQKLVVIDGALAFVGGMDICDERWDERSHAGLHPHRINSAGVSCRPNHEVQSAVAGPAAEVLAEQFAERWQAAVGERLLLEPYPASPAASIDLIAIDDDAVMPLSAERVAIARTLPATGVSPVCEVKAAFSAALSAAERLIYVETQYFTSRSITSVLLDRLRDPNKPRLQVLILMPRGADNSKEKFALGDLQASALSELEQAAETHGHDLRFLCSAIDGDDCGSATFIHSKVLMVDDELLCIGSANMTERSMSLDSELCLLWQAERGSGLAADIARVRASLLAEHAGRTPEELMDATELTRKLDEWLSSNASRLRVCHFDPVSVSPIKEAIFDPAEGVDLFR